MSILVTRNDRSVGRLGKFFKSALAWLVLMLLAYFALAALRHSTTPLNDVMGVPFDGRTVAAVPQRDESSTLLPGVLASKATSEIQEPRECDTSKGVTTACVFE